MRLHFEEKHIWNRKWGIFDIRVCYMDNCYTSISLSIPSINSTLQGTAKVNSMGFVHIPRSVGLKLPSIQELVGGFNPYEKY